MDHLGQRRAADRGDAGRRGTSAGKGFFLSGPDIEELSLVLRVGNEVEILAKAP